MNGYQDVRPGDCVVAFSRKAIFEIKSFIESTTGLRWVVGLLCTMSAAALQTRPELQSTARLHIGLSTRDCLRPAAILWGKCLRRTASAVATTHVVSVLQSALLAFTVRLLADRVSAF